MAELKDFGKRLAAVAILSALIALSVGVACSSAAFIHKAGVSERFGTDGTEGSFIEATSMTIDQGRQRLYANVFSGNTIQIHAFDLPAHTTTGGKFPLQNGGSGTVAVDQSTGHIFLQSTYRGTSGWDAEGNPLNPAVFPIPPSKLDQCSAAVDSHGNIWITESGRAQVQEFSSVTGDLMQTVNVKAATSSPCRIAFDESNDDMYIGGENGFGPGGLYRLTAASGYHAVNTLIYQKEFQPNSIAVDPDSHLVYVTGGLVVPNNINTTPEALTLTPTGGVVQTFKTGSGANFSYGGVAIDDQTGTLYLGDENPQQVDVLPGQIVPTVTAQSPTNVTTTSLVAHGHVDPAGGGPVTGCYLEWGTTLDYGEPTIPCSPSTTFSTPEDVSAELTGLEPGKTYHYRFAATNAEGKDMSGDQAARAAGKPLVESVYANEISETGATLHGEINPEALETTYWFEYGLGVQYGTRVPVSGETLAAGQETESIHQALTGLSEGRLYHYRLVAENSAGTTFSEDHSFDFYPQNCPNSVLRQETGSEYLPDCRAYELVSPGNAGNVILVPENAQPGPLASNPSRFAYGGELGGVTGTEPLNSLNLDTYVATRTSSGWKTALVGLKGNEVLGASLTYGDQKFDEFFDFYQGGGFEGVKQPGHNLPYIWDPEGNFLGRWPLTQPLIPNAEATVGAFQPSPDFSHMAFTSINVAFTLNGLVVPPGSAYDYNTESGSTTLISRLPGGEELDIPEPPAADPSETETPQYIYFAGMQKSVAQRPTNWSPARMHPGVSTDGSHILMSVADGEWSVFAYENEPEPPSYLYMRVNDSVTYEIGDGHPVHYQGMTADGKKVFFTTGEQITSEDTDHSVDLYMWTEEHGGEIKLVSKGASGAGNEENCEPNLHWTEGCDAVPIVGAYQSDSPVAEEAGDIYFYSPELLDGNRNGVRGQQNLYRYHDGTVSFVATLTNHETYCPAEGCSNGPIGRIQVTPDGEHVAFLTRNQLTPYANDGFEEMYTYDPNSGAINCVSCMPNGEAPTGDTAASLQGNFMTYDGRTFFYSPDPLTPKDTNKIKDVYEYTEGRPQLITPGTSAVNSQTSNFHERGSGFEGVSADGTDVYFSTYDTLVGQDENGQSLKFYDARAAGGFPYVPPSAPCEAADECHGEGSEPPNSAGIVSNVNLGEGANVPSKKANKAKKAKKHKKKKKARARRHHHRHAGGSR